VYPWNIDHVGHMNVQFYVGKFDEASKLLASLNHPNIAAIYGLEEARGGRRNPG